MDRPRLKRGLRIAWSVVFGILCVLLIVLWIRSYYYLDDFGGPPQIFTSWRGRLFTGGIVYGTLTSDGTDPSEPELRTVLGVFILTTIDQNHLSYEGGYSLPIAALVFLMGAVVAVPWLPWKYSLRTFLIATTLIALLLGLVVWVMS